MVIARGGEEQAQVQEQWQLHYGTQAAAWSITIAIQQAVTANASARHERKSPIVKEINEWQKARATTSGSVMGKFVVE